MSEDVKAFIAAGNASLKAGDRNGAMLAWCRALDLDPHLATAHNNLGAISLMAGEPWLALPCFLNSTRLRPEQGGFRVGLARTLVELGEPERAAACLADAAKRLPDNAAVQEAARQVTADAAMLTHFDGFADRGGQTEAADWLAALDGLAAGSDPEADYAAARALVWRLPDRPGLWRTLSRLALRVGELQAAEFSARRAIVLAPDETEGWRALARVLSLAETRTADVERVLRRALALCGPRLSLAADLCDRLLAAGQAADARAVLEDLPSGRIGAESQWLLLSARVLDAAGDRAAGAALFAGALAGSKDPAQLLVAAATYHERDLEPGAWLALYGHAEASGAGLDHPDVHHARARALMRAGRHEAAAIAIGRALDGPLGDEARRGASFVAGQIADRLGRFDEAWTHFETGNRLFEACWEADGPCDHTMPLRRLDSLRQRLEAEIAGGTPHALTPDPVTPPVPGDLAAGADLAFLVGFPRSGTTLLDTVLRSHSAIVVIEEAPILINALRDVVPGMHGDETRFTEDWLDSIEAADVELLRAAYRARLAPYLDDAAPGATIIDKLPLNMNWVAVIHRIFPAAAFILARRHPLDVAVSNFAQDYAPNNAMMVMTRLDRIARFHAASCELWDRFVSWRQPRMAAVAYEALIVDPQAAIVPVMALLGRQWEVAQARFFETARARGHIATPSAHQVTQPLYNRSRERWRNYADALSHPACDPLRERAQGWGFTTEMDPACK
jgi:tetratricopeptide (TPR) repeat protein